MAFRHSRRRMKSMTGYGRGECTRGGNKATVELSSVNRKSAEISLNLPRDLDPLEAQIKDEIFKQISRGRVNARITLQAADGFKSRAVRINSTLAKSYAREFRKLAKELKIEEVFSLDTVLRAPGVMETEEGAQDAEEFWSAIRTALRQALKGLTAMRANEGAHLAKDLVNRIAAIEKAVRRIEKRAPAVVQRFREQLSQKLANAGIGQADLNEDRLAREIVLFTDRSDISEELTRLKSHFKQFADTSASGEPVGRKLDFLSQEINREINTIGSKAQDSAISREIVIAKTELEKFREQTQNVE